MNNCINKCISCDVNDCIFNLNGAHCTRSEIEVSKGDSTNKKSPHFCKSYLKKDDDFSFLP